MKLAWLIILIALGGCSGFGTKESIDPRASTTFTVAIAKGDSLTRQQEDDNKLEIERRLSEVLAFCQPILSEYENTAKSQATAAYWLAMSGLVAGSVAVPALSAASASGNTAWIAGLGGWAGATNFASNALRDSGLSGRAVAETRNRIIDDVKKQIEVAIDGSKLDEDRASALVQARAACVLYEIAVPNISQRE